MSLTPHCPLPRDGDAVTLAHGGGGRLTHELVRDVFQAAFGCSTAHDGHVAELPPGRVATTTDSFVVRPLFFEGGDIGTLAVHGTVNDLAMCGARPVSLSAGFIIEEGTDIGLLRRVAQSMARAAAEAGTAIVTGDTKVVERGKGDAVYITTAGIGVCEHNLRVHPECIKAGDAVLLSGDVGRHGMAVMAAREGMSFHEPLRSDCRSLWPGVKALLDAGIEVRCLRDLTRGGLATGVIELAQAAGLEIVLDEDAIAVTPAVQSACELLGFDPLYVANEGCFVAVVPGPQAESALAALQAVPGHEHATQAGKVQTARQGRATLKTTLGTQRNLAMLSGEQLPRIC
jgi:hydrogenase expression/formation protein HypE